MKSARAFALAALLAPAVAWGQDVCEADRRALDIMAAKHGQYEMWAAQTIARQEAQLKAVAAQLEALKKEQAGGAKKETPTP